ncbi:MAG: hypothetical protein V7746_01850 [Halioglobus sp.]
MILFASKLFILGAINFGFGDEVRFLGPMHGALAFIVVVMVMLLAEEFVVRLVRRLG